MMRFPPTTRQFAILMMTGAAASCCLLQGITAQEASMSATPGYSAEQVEFFESKIRPALVKHCYECHSTDSEKVKGGLLLDSRAASLRGGDSGPSVVPHDLDESLLYAAITYEDSNLEMPPKYKLDDAVVADFRRWIEMGAADPREEIGAENRISEKYSNSIDLEKGREFWAYQKPRKSKLPAVSNTDWPRTELDYYILSRLDAEGMEPSADATAATLLRRLHFDLVGLPPTPQQVQAFLKGYAKQPEKTLERAVDELLASEQFGERWGRHWLDVARYAESTGRETNALYPNAWRYRDYVIDAFNDDKPYDRFIQEQVAGDLLSSSSKREKSDLIVATGFLAIGTKGLNDQNNRRFKFDLVDEQIDTTTKAILGTTVACARCHDHKFDPIPMSDYYAMAGIFLSSDTYFGTPSGVQNRHDTPLIELPAPDVAPPIPSLTLGQSIDLQFRLDQQKEQLADILAEARAARQNGNADEAQRIQQQALRLRTTSGVLESEAARYGADGTPLALAMGVLDSDDPFDSQLLIRGEEGNATSERVPRGYLQVVQTGDEEPIGPDESGRLQLAHWMTSPENPLPARVMTNRIWHWIFGQGIVSSVDNFGHTGQRPSHPELLDQLAIRFIEKNWSVKDMIREIVLSRTYRQASTFNEDHFLKDPQNALLWRVSPRRLDAESLRDAVLAVSGTLDSERPAASPVARVGSGFVGRGGRDQTPLSQENVHRSVYLPIVRDLVPEALALFDFADPSLMSGKRDVTTVPSQALYLMNSDFIIRNAEAMAKRLFVELELRGPRLISTAFYLAYARPPTDEETRKTSAYLERFLEVAETEGLAKEDARRLAFTTFCQSLLSSAEFRYLN